MYVCICNALTDRQINGAIAKGLEDPFEIYASLGCAPQCGKCLPMVEDLVQQHRPAAADTTADKAPRPMAALAIAAE